MLFYENLENIIFDRHQLFKSDELIVLSGYVGPSPVKRLSTLPLNTTVVYGMYGSEGIRKRLHNSLLELRNANTTILYSNIPIHSKCYIWKNKKETVHALVGSANFSTNGLSTPYREVLAETTHDTFAPLDAYLNKIFENCITCDKHVSTREIPLPQAKGIIKDPEVCEMLLYDPRTNETQNSAALNWGQSIKAHVNLNDAYIPIRREYVKNYPQLFLPKQTVPSLGHGGRPQRHNDFIEIIWDDGTTMEGLFEGNQDFDGVIYPKQISSSPRKSLMGEYLRRRIGVTSGKRVFKADLDRYGRTSISVSLQSEGIYFFDFSV